MNGGREGKEKKKSSLFLECKKKKKLVENYTQLLLYWVGLESEVIGNGVHFMKRGKISKKGMMFHFILFSIQSDNKDCRETQKTFTIVSEKFVWMSSSSCSNQNV